MADPTPFEPDPTYDNSPNTHQQFNDITPDEIKQIINARLNGAITLNYNLKRQLEAKYIERSDAEFRQYLLRRRRIKNFSNGDP